MKLKLLSTKGEQKGELDLPAQFDSKVRPDLIKRAYLSVVSSRRQPYGADPEAGKKASSKISRRRRDYKGSYGIGISRVPRKIVSYRGTRFNWIGATAPNTVGGRRAHPPKAAKSLLIRINKKERRAAIRSAIAATQYEDYVKTRGHKIPENYPFAVEDSAESLKKTSDVIKMLEALGFADELARSTLTKIRPGKGKARGRKKVGRKGCLIAVSDKNCSLASAAKNIPGVDVVEVTGLNAELLAPGGVCGRAAVFTQAAIKRIADESLFTDNPKIKKATKMESKPVKSSPKAPTKTNIKTPAKQEPKPKAEKPEEKQKKEKSDGSEAK